MGTTTEMYFDAIDTGDILKVALYLRQGIDIESLGQYNLNGLMHAILCEHTELALFFINQGINLVHKDKNEETAMAYAIYMENLDVIHAILDRGLHIDADVSKLHTPLAIAASQYSDNMVDLFLSRGADPKKSYLDGPSALDIAKSQRENPIFRYSKILEKLLAHTKY